MPDSPQAVRHCSYKNSAVYGQSKAEAIKIVRRYTSLLRRKRTSRGSSYSSISSQPTA